MSCDYLSLLRGWTVTDSHRNYYSTDKRLIIIWNCLESPDERCRKWRMATRCRMLLIYSNWHIQCNHWILWNSQWRSKSYLFVITRLRLFLLLQQLWFISSTQGVESGSLGQGKGHKVSKSLFCIDLCEEHQKYTKHYLWDFSLIASYFLASIWRRH